MISIKKVVSICIITLITSLASAGVAYSQNRPEALVKLTAQFDQGKVLKSIFQHQVIDSFTNDTTQQRGEIWLNTEGYKIRTETTTLLVDGQISRVYDKMKNRVIVSEYEPEEDDFAPSQLLTDIKSTYSSVEQQQRAGQTVIILKSDDYFSTFQKVEIYLNEQHIPAKIVATDQADNQLVTTFNNPAFIPSTPEIFTLTYPDNTDIVDLRPQKP